ncbi:hypothetical protein NADFUDRAFT_42552 [Nadsonia fulvescens var. elongata DSM 6958]|uniref:Nitrogen regulatory protein areA GATA-like domain-containing protein n=1 Tax=Nadsonia fulvescens var. elongata DSM 6958 TaxID=857566 RepID=A0A1E3PK95_9ASCO|nr:hypothetical protein NADFUDRAFT_42552 [Nadsonia fulvescens var. elongata DSM 6958]
MPTEVPYENVTNCALQLPHIMKYSSPYLNKPRIPILSLSSQVEKSFQNSNDKCLANTSSPYFPDSRSSSEPDDEDLNTDDDLRSQRLMENLFSLWLIISKCPESIENGRRLENISWRLWNREVLFNGVDSTSENLGNFEGLFDSKIVAPVFPSIQNLSGPVKQIPGKVYKCDDQLDYERMKPSKPYYDNKPLNPSPGGTSKSKRTLSTARLQQIVSMFKPDANLSTDYNFKDIDDKTRYFNQLRTEVKRLKISPNIITKKPFNSISTLSVVPEKSSYLLPEALSSQFKKTTPPVPVKVARLNPKDKPLRLTKKKNKAKCKDKSGSTVSAKPPVGGANKKMFFIEDSACFSNDDADRKILKKIQKTKSENKKFKLVRQSAKPNLVKKQDTTKSQHTSTQKLITSTASGSEWDSEGDDEPVCSSFLHKDIPKPLSSGNHFSKLSSLLLSNPDRAQAQLEANRRKVESANTLLKRSASRGKTVDAVLSNCADINFNKPYFVSNDFKHSSASTSLKEVAKSTSSGKLRQKRLTKWESKSSSLLLSETSSVDSCENISSDEAVNELLSDAIPPKSLFPPPTDTPIISTSVSVSPAVISSSDSANYLTGFSDLSESLVKNVERQKYLIDSNLNRTQRTKSLFNCQNLYQGNNSHPRIHAVAEISVSFDINGHCEQWKVDMDIDENANFNCHARGW